MEMEAQQDEGRRHLARSERAGVQRLTHAGQPANTRLTQARAQIDAASEHPAAHESQLGR